VLDARPFDLAELIDFELALADDDEREPEDLAARDERLARAVAEPWLTRERSSGSDRGVLRRWLVARSGGRTPTPGTRVAEWVELTAVLLFVAGGLTGALTIGGWLLQGTGTPINIAVFWPAVIGSQLLLLLLVSLLGCLLRVVRWLPGARAIERITSALSAALPWLTLRILARTTGGTRAEAERLLGGLRAIDRLYRPLRIWLMLSLTQGFAIGFNLGAVIAFVALPSIDDPAFGWRSRLLDPHQIHRAAIAVALPWSSWLPRAVPTYSDVLATRYSSVSPRYLEGAASPPTSMPRSSSESAAESESRSTSDSGSTSESGSTPESGAAYEAPREREVAPSSAAETANALGASSPWGIWWPFLCASLVTYGLLPRLTLWLLSRAMLYRTLARCPRSHAGSSRLLQRLERLAVDTRAGAPELVAERNPSPALASDGPDAARPLHLLCWDGIPLSAADLARALEATGFSVASASRVGAVDFAADRDALDELRDLDRETVQVCVVVEAWEPPVGDYMDFLEDVRRRLGPERPIFVLLFPTSRPGESTAPERLKTYTDQWNLQLRSLGDPWLHLTLFPAEPA